MENKLEFGAIIKNGLDLGLKNFVPVFVNVLLWALTIWIPYLNVGTTIGLVGLPAKMGKANASISPTEIFNPDYRKYMGEYFLVTGFMLIGILAGFMLLAIPGMVIGIAWSLAPLLVLDKGMSPLDAINKSNKLTYGNKWTIFLAQFALMVLLYAAIAIVVTIAGKAGSKIVTILGGLIALGLALGIGPVLMGASGYVYNTLSKNS